MTLEGEHGLFLELAMGTWYMIDAENPAAEIGVIYYGGQQEARRIPYARPECRLGDTARLSERHRAEDPVGRARRDKQARHAHAAPALRAWRVHDQALRARILGRGLPRL